MARKVLKRVNRCLAMVIANLINCHDPDAVILSGYVVDASEGALLRQMRRLVPRYVVDAPARRIQLEASSLGEDAALMGAATLVYQRHFSFAHLTG